MPKTVKLALATLSLLLLLLIAAALAVLGLLSTESGTALVARQVQQNLGDSIGWQQLSGSITGPLHISGLTFTQPGLSLTADQIDLDWSPSALLRGRLELSSLTAAGVDVALSPTATEEPTPLLDPSSVRSPVSVFLPRVDISDLRISQEGQSQQIDSIRLAGSFAGDSLVLDPLVVRAPEGELTLRGETRLNSSMPVDLTTHWTYKLPESAPFSGESQLTGNMHWSDSIGLDLEYSLTASGLQSLQADLPGTVGASGKLNGQYRGNSVELETLSIDQHDGELGLVLVGSIVELDTESPGVVAALTWQGLRWPLAGESPDVESPQGELRISGSMDDYALELALNLSGAAVPPGSWKATGKGTQSQLDLDSLQGQLLEGDILVQGAVSWDPAPRWQLQIAANNLNPGVLVTEAPGKLAARLSTHGEIDPDAQLQAHFTVQQVQGQLAGYPLSLSGAGTVDGDAVQLTHLQLDSGRNGLSATGQVSEQALDLDWKLRALAPGELLEGASGQVTGQGRLTGSSELPRISASIRGDELQLDTLQIPALTLSIAAGMQANDALEVELLAGPVSDSGTALLQSLAIDAKGSNADHRINLKVDTGPEQLAAKLSGGIADTLDAWSGTLNSLLVQSDEFGSWQLQQRSDLELSAVSARLDESCLGRIDASGNACIRGSWSTESASDFAAKINKLPVSLVQPNISGEITATIEGQLAADGSLLADGSIGLGAGLINIGEGQKPLEHGGGALDFKINQQGLNGRLDFAAPESGTLEAAVQLPALTALPLAKDQPLTGNVRASLPDLSGMAAWVPELAATGGAIEVDMQLAGALSKPRVLGSLRLINAYADVPLAGLKISELQLEAVSTDAQPDTLAIRGSASSGPGNLELSGALNMADASLQLDLTGADFQAYNTRDARVQLSPDLKISWAQDTLTLRGEVFVPFADITPTLELNPAVSSEDGEQPDTLGRAIAPSSDVVIVSGEVEGLEEFEMAAPFKIDNQIRLRLGDSVNINAVGFMGRLSGDVLFSNTPQQVELVPIANGKLSVEDGTFRSFGQDLDIRTGELLFNNKPATEPEINLRAVRWIDNDPQVTSAGILLTGPINTPTMELFSRPQLETSEVQSYLITGRSTRDRNSVLSLGTYVTPRIYVGYGYNTLEKTSEFNSLFTITPRYGVGLNVGEADSNLNMTITYER